MFTKELKVGGPQAPHDRLASKQKSFPKGIYRETQGLCWPDQEHLCEPYQVKSEMHGLWELAFGKTP